MPMDFSRLSKPEALGAAAGILLVVSLFFFPWYSLTETEMRAAGESFLCGDGEFSCTGWETFPILGPLLILAAAAPLILAFIVVRGIELSWVPGEATMIAGFAATVLIGYNGIIDKPGTGVGEIGVTTDWGYWVALAAAIGIAAAGYWRSVEAGGPRERKAPGTV
ncbi:MAG: hypothetical protein ACR2N5_07695 [Solirubrobacterales bacterium]